MKKSHFILFLVFICKFSHSQEVISTQGSSYNNSNFTLDFTMGEVLINKYMTGSVNLSQGFHQPSWEVVGVKDFLNCFNVTVFPNPASSFLNIKTSEVLNVNYTLVDVQGVSVIHGFLRNEEAMIELNFLSPGVYFLIFKRGTLKLKSITILKY